MGIFSQRRFCSRSHNQYVPKCVDPFFFFCALRCCRSNVDFKSMSHVTCSLSGFPLVLSPNNKMKFCLPFHQVFCLFVCLWMLSSGTQGRDWISMSLSVTYFQIFSKLYHSPQQTAWLPKSLPMGGNCVKISTDPKFLIHKPWDYMCFRIKKSFFS